MLDYINRSLDRERQLTKILRYEMLKMFKWQVINSFARFRNGPEDHVDLANKLQASVKLSQKVKQLLNFSVS